MGVVLSFCNQKGGVGKTSCCMHLGGTLALLGRRVLLLDNDPQASLTQGFFGPAAFHQISGSESTAALYDAAMIPSPLQVVRETGIDGVSIVPGSPHLARVNTTPEERWGPVETGLKAFLAVVRELFDLILIDNPPNLYLCTNASLVAADGLVVPLQAEDYGAQGVGPVVAAADAVRAVLNPDLRLIGYLVTMFDQRLGLHQGYDAVLREEFGADVFTARVPRAKDFAEAVAARTPVSHFRPKSAAARSIRAVAEEIVVRVNSTSGVRGVA